MKRDSHYKFPREMKTMMALQRTGTKGSFKNVMIDGEIAGNVVPEKGSNKMPVQSHTK